jgi:hypothetical protein
VDAKPSTGQRGDASETVLSGNMSQVRLHEWVGNDHYDPIPIREFRVVLDEEGTTFPVFIPAT